MRILLLILMLTVPAPRPGGVTTTDVSFVGAGGVVLHGTVVAPSGQGRKPGLVLLSGAGDGGRQELLPAAVAFARRGVVSLVYDKRTVGYSLFHRDYSVLADDAVAAVRLLRARTDVDPARLGLWALSEGAFVAPLAANRSPDVRFLITVGAVGMPPAQETSWAYGQFLGHAGVSGSLVHTMRSTATRVTVGAGLFAEGRFDPLPAWSGVRQPVLAQWGGDDRQAVPAESSALIEKALRNNKNVTIRFVPGLRHDLNVTHDGGFDRTAELPADFGAFETTWLNHPTPGRFGTPPADGDPSTPVPTPAWWEAPPVQLAVILVLLGCFVCGVGSRTTRRPAVIGLVTTVGTLGYLFFMLASAANIVGPVLLGRPLPWLALQVLAVATVVAIVVRIARWSGKRGFPWGLLVSGGLVFVPWSVYWGLLMP